MREENLMLQVRLGSQEAARELFIIYNIKLFNFFLRRCRDRNLSEDLTQNVFLRMIKYKDSYNEKYSFRPWIYQISRNVLNEHFKKNQIQISDYSVPEDIADTEVTDDYQVDTLNKSLAKLDIEERELIELSRYQKLKYEEIADITGLSVANIKVKIHRAIKKLREHYFKLQEN